MKIALFSETYLPQINGVATHIKTLKEGLETLGHRVLVVTADPKAAGHYVEHGILHCPATELKDLYGYGMAASYSPERMRFIKEFSPDIAHVHTEFGIGSTGLETARELRIPLIYTLHTMWDEYLHYIASPTLFPAVRRLVYAYIRYFAKQADAIIGPSEKVQKFLDTCGAGRKVNMRANAVEFDRFSPEQADRTVTARLRCVYGLSPDNLVICFCGRLAREKSVDVLIDYFAVCQRADERIRLMIIGDGPELAELKSRVMLLGLTDAVIFTGAVPHDSVREVYACCDLYATASRSEVNSISMLEAMAMGLPVLYIKDEANAGQVTDGVNGYIFRNAEELCAAVFHYRDRSEAEKQQLRSSTRLSVCCANQINMAGHVEAVYISQIKRKAAIRKEIGKGGGSDGNA